MPQPWGACQPCVHRLLDLLHYQQSPLSFGNKAPRLVEEAP